MSVQAPFPWSVRGGTEFHAYRRAGQLLPDSGDCHYWAIPWSCEEIDTRDLKPSESTFGVTVCHAPDLSPYRSAFLRLGITDVFWPYKVKGVDFLGDTAIRLWAFPVATEDKPIQTGFRQYDGAVPVQDFVWSCVGTDTLPVFTVNSDLSPLSLPGHSALWEDVLISGSVRSELDKDTEKVEQRLQSLRQLKFQFGHDGCFIYDIVQLFLNPEGYMRAAQGRHGVKAMGFEGWIHSTLVPIEGVSSEEASYLVTALGSELLKAPVGTINLLLGESDAIQMVKRALALVSVEKREHFYRVWNHYDTTRALDGDTI